MKAIVSALSLAKRLTQTLALVVVFLLPSVLLAQPIGPGPAGGGGAPEVPFDDNMNIMFLIAGVLFAVIITVKKMRKRAVATA